MGAVALEAGLTNYGFGPSMADQALEKAQGPKGPLGASYWPYWPYGFFPSGQESEQV